MHEGGGEALGYTTTPGARRYSFTIGFINPLRQVEATHRGKVAHECVHECPALTMCVGCCSPSSCSRIQPSFPS